MIHRRAINKAKKDGFKDLIVDGCSWTVGKLHKNYKIKCKNPVLRRYNKYRRNYVENIDFIYIDPSDVNHYLIYSIPPTYTFGPNYDKIIPIHKLEKGRFNPELYTGMILSGDWDIYKQNYEKDRVFVSLKQHYRKGKDWENTDYGHHLWLRGKIRNKDNYFAKRVNSIEKTHESVREHGIIKQHTLKGKEKERPEYKNRPWDININIGRNGELIYNNYGHNRFAMARLLGLDEIPAFVVVRHKQWMEIREEFEQAKCIDELTKKARKHVDHPDLQEFDVSR